MTHELWSTLNDRIYEFLSSVTLADEVKKQRQINDTELPALRNVRSNSELQPQQLMAL